MTMMSKWPKKAKRSLQTSSSSSSLHPSHNLASIVPLFGASRFRSSTGDGGQRQRGLTTEIQPSTRPNQSVGLHVLLTFPLALRKSEIKFCKPLACVVISSSWSSTCICSDGFDEDKRLGRKQAFRPRWLTSPVRLQHLLPSATIHTHTNGLSVPARVGGTVGMQGHGHDNPVSSCQSCRPWGLLATLFA
jgi:hypothetical protein